MNSLVLRECLPKGTQAGGVKNQYTNKKDLICSSFILILSRLISNLLSQQEHAATIGWFHACALVSQRINKHGFTGSVSDFSDSWLLFLSPSWSSWEWPLFSCWSASHAFFSLPRGEASCKERSSLLVPSQSPLLETYSSWTRGSCLKAWRR